MPLPPRHLACLATILMGSIVGAPSSACAAGPVQDAEVRKAVDEAMKPVIAQYGLPGMAVAVSVDGRRHFMAYGLASKEPQVPVTRDTLFELGSISKTFTATLATYAEVEGRLKLTDSVSRHMPELKGSAFDKVRLVDLATHTAGGFPLQLPASVKDRKQLIAYYRAWKPTSASGTWRSYANPSIGLLGLVTARAMDASFTSLAERLFGDLGLRRTYVEVPAAEMKSYAWGYGRDGKPVRVSRALLADEAYGVKSNAVDMIRFLEVNMGIGSVPEPIARSLRATRTCYFRSGELTQGLIWEQYPYPVALDTFIAGNTMNQRASPAFAIDPPLAPRDDVIVNKTGSTLGFGAYVAFVPGRKIGIVMLANKAYPNEARVRAAHQVLSRLTE
ncbi:class C beta-lactamase [Microvirga lotononidis]|uniref:Beta-lactamase n=1 Tax=Microvirga lotononidis TaxID=864069 RepID=I4YV55_9HYPH|nr:class C beta-lactamase [Microvirga lotononidis]EIM27847.1 penicillin-binding protein, beta-lactamase class C [Microvirga lotononidis]WQO28023.1 class C beta-lactamase [Microvirga lotononidis]